MLPTSRDRHRGYRLYPDRLQCAGRTSVVLGRSSPAPTLASLLRQQAPHPHRQQRHFDAAPPTTESSASQTRNCDSTATTVVAAVVVITVATVIIAADYMAVGLVVGRWSWWWYMR
eukprot:GHVU01084582.1.p1 GENE.GHVU01084582.1~~GHVU01084582.1.p1  ORF type:complete len:116 (+),score=7.28 GHVU01084582.1:144-491(+)